MPGAEGHRKSRVLPNTPAGELGCKYLPLHGRRRRLSELPDGLYEPGKQSDFNPDERHRDAHLFVLDSLVPDPANLHRLCELRPRRPLCGDITAFYDRPQYRPAFADPNQQVKNPTTGTNLSYFPIGSSAHLLCRIPAVTALYLYDRERQRNVPPIPSRLFMLYEVSSGQLTLTQNTPIPTYATQFTYIYASASTCI